MALPSEVATLMEALDRLQSATTPTALASFSRAVSRAADDLELVCEETVDPSLCDQLISYVERARGAVKTARKNARAAALKADRAALIEPPTLEHSETRGTAGRLAAEINDALRATAAVVSEEIQRSKVAGDIVDESTRRLKMTKDQHGVYADGLISGASTLKSIRRTDLVANCVLVLCFALFFVAAAYVANRRLSNSNVATFIVRPAYKISSLPFRISAWVFKRSFSKPDSPHLHAQSPFPTDPPDGEHYSTDKDLHDRKPLEELQKTPYVIPSQNVEEGIESDHTQHSGQPQAPVEDNVIDDRAREDPEEATAWGEDDGIDDSTASDVPTSGDDKHSAAMPKSSPSYQYEGMNVEVDTTLTDHAVQKTKSTEPTSLLSSKDSDENRGLDQKPFVVDDKDSAEDTVQNDRQGLAIEKELKTQLDLMLSENQSVTKDEHIEREADPKPTEEFESLSKKSMDEEAPKGRSPKVSSDSKDDQLNSQQEPQELSEDLESETLLVIPLPSQDETSEAGNVVDGKNTSEAVEQQEIHVVKDENDARIVKESNATAAFDFEAKNSDEREPQDSSRPKEREIQKEQVSESGAKIIDTTITAAAGGIKSTTGQDNTNHQEGNAEERKSQNSYPAPVVFEEGRDLQLEGRSVNRVHYDLKSICLVPGIDSVLLQICAVSTEIYS